MIFAEICQMTYKPTYEELEKRNSELEAKVLVIEKFKKEAKEREVLLQAFTSALPNISFILDEEGKYIEIFGSQEFLLYVSSEKLLGSYLHDILPKDIADEFHAIVKRTIATQEPQLFEYKLDMQGGETWFDGITSPMQEQVNGKNTFAWLAFDITERKRAETAVRESEEKYRNLASLLRSMCDNVPDMIWAKDLHKRYIFANKALCRELLNSADTDEPLGKTDLFFALRERARHPDDPTWHTFGELCQDSDQITLDENGPRQFDEYGNVQGQFLYLDVRKAPFIDETGQTIGTVGSARDITAYKRANEALHQSLADKEVLLREVHHRVKNNMAAIIGLFEMQQLAMEDSTARTLLGELSSRVRAMSLVHEKLYRSESLTSIDFQEYTESLLSHLRTSFGSPAIQCKIDAREVAIPLDLAVPCGMIINELVTNCLKYAFPKTMASSDQEACNIVVTLSCRDTQFSLTVADNGVGWPEDFDWRTAKSLGLTLVRMLGEHQLGGSYTVDRGDGIRFTLTFSLRPPSNVRKTHA
jgi:PAS domain S-box-containing protein